MRIYMDLGTHEMEGEKEVTGDYEWSTEWCCELLIKQGFAEDEIMLFQAQDGEHSEADWAARFPAAYLWLYEHEVAVDEMVAEA